MIVNRPSNSRKPVLDPGFDVFEMERVTVIDPVRAAYCDARLSYALKSLDDKCPVTLVKRLIAADE